MEQAFIGRVLSRDPRGVARALSIVADASPDAIGLLTAVASHTGHARVIGITGPPGAGKSTIVDRLISAFRRADRSVAVLAVDPSSPLTGGATLGDRVRMQGHADDDSVFIRSLATRGHLGGLTATARDAVTVLDAAGFDVVIIETVGVGQGEVDVAELADLCVVVLVPGTGDDVQALKAGLMEIADIFVVNKADRDGAAQLVASIQSTQALAMPPETGCPKVLPVVATTGEGIPALVMAIAEVPARARRVADSHASARREARGVAAVREALVDCVIGRVGESALVELARRVADGELEPRHAAAQLLESPPEVGVTLDHLAVAVANPTALLGFLADAFGAAADVPEEVGSQQVRVRFMAFDGAHLEIVEPMGDASPVARFLERRGPGLHHVAFGVDNLPAILALLSARGVRLIDAVPRVGAHGRAIAFVHPGSTGGVLVELVQKAGTARGIR